MFQILNVMVIYILLFCKYLSKYGNVYLYANIGINNIPAIKLATVYAPT